MRINSIASQINVEAVKKLEQERKNVSGSGKTSHAKDASHISSEAKRLHETAGDVNTVQTQVQNQPEIRTERVEEVKAKIKNGFYNSDAFIDRLTEKIMKDFGL